MLVIATASTVMATQSQLSVFTVGVADEVIEVTRFVMRLFVIVTVPLSVINPPVPFVAIASAVASPVPNPLTPVLIGKPVHELSVPLLGVPNAPPLTTNAPAVPTLTFSAVATPVPGVVVANSVNPNAVRCAAAALAP